MAVQGIVGCPETVPEVRRLDRFDSAGSPNNPPTLDGYYRVSGLVEGEYTRTYNAWGPFRLEYSGESFCSNVISQLEPNWWETRITRGSEIMYTGTIREIEQSAGTAGAIIRGGDIISEFAEDGGKIPILVDVAYVDTDPVDIAADVIRRTMAITNPTDAYLIDDYLYTNTVGETIDYEPGLVGDYLIDLLDDLTQYGLMYAAVGRRIILSSMATLDNDPVAVLSSTDFEGDVRVTKTSLDMGVLGIAVRDTQGQDEPDIFTYGEMGSPYGLPAVRVDVDPGVSDRSAQNAARRAIQGRTRPAYRVTMPSSARLLPTAPIRPTDLRPGSARIDVEIRNIPVPIRQPCLLTEVRFEFAPDVDDVRISLAPIGEPVLIPPGG